MLPARKLRTAILFFSLLAAFISVVVLGAAGAYAQAQPSAAALPDEAGSAAATATGGDPGGGGSASTDTLLAQAGPRLSEQEAKRLAASQMNISQVLGKHPELERIAEYDAGRQRWTVTYRNPTSGRTLAIVVIDDPSGIIISSDIKAEAWFEFLPAMTEQEAIDLARNQPKIVDELKGHDNVTEDAELGDDGVWTIGFKSGQDKFAEVLINDATGTVQEVRIGPQVAWQMARGYRGAFGRIINEPYVWLPLCIIFLVPFVDVRSPLKLLHLDLIMLLAFTVSHYFFNQGEIFRSVPLAYPPLLYIFVRTAWLGWKRGSKRRKQRKGEGAAEAEVLGEPHLNFGSKYLIIGIALLIAFRVCINIADSNVVDVGYSGVIGAHLIQEGKAPYGNMPSDNGNGDTYGPFNYLVYVPFERILPWSGSWDELPAAHATAIIFDLLAAAGMFAAGRTLARGRPHASRLGLALTWAWVAYPYTTFVLNCNVNDSIVAALVIWGFVFLKRAPLAGALLGFATMTKFLPAILGPLWASFPRALRGWGRRLLFVTGFAAALASTLPVIFLGGGTLQVFWEKTVKWQISRESPFSIWGQYPSQLGRVQLVLQILLVAAALVTYFWPLRKDMLRVAAISAALIVGFQLVQTHWFYLYIPWFFPLAFIAMYLSGSRSRNRGLDITRSYIVKPLQPY